jgi:hypothetical protein
MVIQIQLLCFWTLSIVLLSLERFRDWILFPSSGGTYWARSIELVRLPKHHQSQELLYDWQFTANQFVLVTSPLTLTTSNFFFPTEHLQS